MVEWVKRNSVKWFSHVEMIVIKEFVKVYESALKGSNRGGKPLGRWKDRVEEYLGEKGVNARE